MIFLKFFLLDRGRVGARRAEGALSSFPVDEAGQRAMLGNSLGHCAVVCCVRAGDAVPLYHAKLREVDCEGGFFHHAYSLPRGVRHP